VWNLGHFPDTVNQGNANPFHLAVDQHLTGAALANPAFQAPAAVFQAVAVDGKARLVKGCSDGEALVSLHCGPVIPENLYWPFFDLNNRMLGYFMHGTVSYLTFCTAKVGFLKNFLTGQKNF
jgi:hypothetical protein